MYLGEGATFIKLSEEKANYIGGMGVQLNNDILEFEVPPGSNYCDWRSISNPYYRSNSAEDQSYLIHRYGHLGLKYTDKIIIFGGEKGKKMRPS